MSEQQQLTQKSTDYDDKYHNYYSEMQAKLDLSELDIPDEMLNDYDFVSKLGEGSQGNVYKAVRKSDGLSVAVKKIRIDSVSTWKEYDLFHREADVLASIHEHGVAEFYEAREFLNEKKPSAFIVQELIEGRSLQLMLKTGYRFTISRIFKMACGLVELLERLHAHQPPIIHRDIKPNNIIMRPLQNTDDFEPCLIDFGAVANPTVQKGGSTVAGTYGYMPPEQLVGRPCPASDIYSLGATIVYMLTGVEPADMRVADFRLIIDPYLENVPRSIVTVLHKLLEPKPEIRFADYGELKSIFSRFANDDYSIESDESSVDANAIDEQLSKVNAFNQAGNLDLWMQLSESVPRTVPNAMASVLISSASIELKNNQQQAAKNKFAPMLVLGGLALMVIFVLGVLVDLDFVIWAIVGLAVIILWWGGMRGLQRRSTSKQNERNKKLIQGFNNIKTPKGIEIFCGYEKFDDIPMLKLLKFGRKAIAIIIDFEDQPIPDKYRSLKNGDIVSKSRVPFKLRYRFNPPDDACADDLIHEITIYNHQTEGLEPGTPIPILYYIDPENNSNVWSMPYPFPFKEIMNTQLTLLNKVNLYGVTKGVY